MENGERLIVAALIENRVIRTKDTNRDNNFHELCCNSKEGSQESFFFFNKKELFICVMGESDPIEKKRSVDDREENGMCFTSTGGWEVHLQ